MNIQYRHALEIDVLNVRKKDQGRSEDLIALGHFYFCPRVLWQKSHLNKSP